MIGADEAEKFGFVNRVCAPETLLKKMLKTTRAIQLPVQKTQFFLLTAFQNPVYVGLYVLAMVMIALHVSHGFWSLFQTFGLNHPKYMPAINAGGLILSLVFGLGFGFLPIYIAFIA